MTELDDRTVHLAAEAARIVWERTGSWEQAVTAAAPYLVPPDVWDEGYTAGCVDGWDNRMAYDRDDPPGDRAENPYRATGGDPRAEQPATVPEPPIGYQVVQTGGVLELASGPSAITLAGDDGHPLLVIRSDGTFTMDFGDDADAAAQAFKVAVGRLMPQPRDWDWEAGAGQLNDAVWSGGDDD